MEQSQILEELTHSRTNRKDKAVVVLSGGQDSVTCLGLALQRHGEGNIAAIFFNYGQRHLVEQSCAMAICAKYIIPLKIVDLTFLGKLVTSALTNKEDDISKEHPDKKGLPASFVPSRNALFLTLAHAHAQEIGATSIYTGVCQTDYSGYPDCRATFINALESALNIGYQTSIEIRTPLMCLTKASTFELAKRVAFLGEVIHNSHTCYEGVREELYAWGYGCGECPACILRVKGYEEFINDYN